ncbi:histone lysine acetyltransferase CREBBP [Trichonephila clavipes]|nr:histone lysine acetyltransferase CREBBP [Trichonephila clavipes]
MDLSTIKRKLDTGQYQDPWQYVEDVWLMFDNAWLYNRKTSKLAEVFEQEIDPVMQSLGYCCGRKYVFQPQVLCCYGKQLCTIPRDAKYWSFQNRNEKVSNHGPIPITIDCNVVAFIVFEEGFHQPIKRTKQSVLLDVTVFRHTLVD